MSSNYRYLFSFRVTDFGCVVHTVDILVAHVILGNWGYKLTDINPSFKNGRKSRTKSGKVIFKVEARYKNGQDSGTLFG